MLKLFWEEWSFWRNDGFGGKDFRNGISNWEEWLEHFVGVKKIGDEGSE